MDIYVHLISTIILNYNNIGKHESAKKRNVRWSMYMFYIKARSFSEFIKWIIR